MVSIASEWLGLMTTTALAALDNSIAICIASRKPLITMRCKLLAGDEQEGALDRATWTFCSRVLLNLDEFITRE